MNNQKRTSASQLGPNEEIIGILHSVQEEGVYWRLQFFYTYNIEVPSSLVEEKKLEDMIGKRIGIFNHDGSYKLRIIND